MKKVMFALLLVSLLAFLLVKTQLTGQAVQQTQQMPDRAPLNCGDHITEKMPAAITLRDTDPLVQEPCKDGNGLYIERNFFTLDGAGYTIRGASNRWSGISVIEQRGVTIKNSKIKGFSIGIELDYALDSRIEGNTISQAEYAISLKGRSGKNTLQRNFLSSKKAALKWETYKGGNLFVENDLYAQKNSRGVRSVEINAPGAPILCKGTEGNFLAQDMEDTSRLQQGSSCGISPSPFTAEGKRRGKRG